MTTSTAPALKEQTAEQTAAAGAVRVAKLRKIVQASSAGRVEGMVVDTFSASAFVQVYDGLTAKHRALLLSLSLRKSINVCFQLMR